MDKYEAWRTEIDGTDYDLCQFGQSDEQNIDVVASYAIIDRHEGDVIFNFSTTDKYIDVDHLEIIAKDIIMARGYWLKTAFAQGQKHAVEQFQAAVGITSLVDSIKDLTSVIDRR